MTHVVDLIVCKTRKPLTIADVAGYSYIAHAPEGGVSLDPYPNIRVWLGHIEALEGFIPMPVTKLPPK